MLKITGEPGPFAAVLLKVSYENTKVNGSCKVIFSSNYETVLLQMASLHGMIPSMDVFTLFFRQHHARDVRKTGNPLV
jgi:hypothetical protein